MMKPETETEVSSKNTPVISDYHHNTMKWKSFDYDYDG